MLFTTDTQAVAVLSILHQQIPQEVGDCFIEIRQWQTESDEQADLIVEYGRLDGDGELETKCQVKPFFMSPQEILASLNV
ncbi:MAG: hypothetical protein KC449_01105 [Anaerolineales bacterium]|nr:hypothetical protein [Anaerolineales bacterium]